ncbi:MAG TPA: hypothetical protein PL070_08815, partial [Flavobacteriales bacterium]|nr:hypothetical protein [Flavobacteriales bacterium]
LMPGVVTKSDSTTTTIRYRDTIVYTVSDSARIIALVKDIRNWREFMEGLARKPMEARGAHNARVQLTAKGDSLIVSGNCDSLEQRFQNALRDIETLRATDRKELVHVASDKNTIPGWMRGLSRNMLSVALLVVILTACILVVMNRLFKRF